MVIRRLPTDFAVVEHLTPVFTGSLSQLGQGHALYSLTKASLTTPDATLFLARALAIKPGLVQHAGLKDKHAVTSQHVSIAWPSTIAPPRSLSGEKGTTSWSTKLLGFSPRSIEAADIDSNAFTIIVRDLTPADIADMDRRIALLANPANPTQLLIANYFGDQRFGSARHHQGFAAQHLIRGDFETALKLLIATPARKDSGPRRTFTRTLINAWGNWSAALPALPKLPERRAVELLASPGRERDFKSAFAALPNFLQQMAVDAFQSWLWNAVARSLLQSAVPPTCRIDAPDDFGLMSFPHATAIPPEILPIQIPMLSSGWPSSWWPGSPNRGSQSHSSPNCDSPFPLWLSPAHSVLSTLDPPLAIADLTIPGLRRPQFGDATRPLFIAAQQFSANPPTADDSESARCHRLRRTVAFALPRGSYATTVLRSLVL